jgi:hypothetical protein
MKRCLCASLFALALLLPASAYAGHFPYKDEAGANAYFRVYKYPGAPAQLGPWYMYWPLEAHFQMQAPIAYPGWPQAQTLPPGFHAPLPTPYPPFIPPGPTPYAPFQAPAPTPVPGGR